MGDGPIVVTGANGGLGRGVVAGLLARGVAGERIVASVRDPDGAAAFAARGVAVRRGDFGDPAGLASIFRDAAQVLVVSPNVVGEAGEALTRAAIGAARAAGAGRVLYTSHMGTRAGGRLAHHLAAETVLGEPGAPFVSLRHGFYASSAMFLIGDGIERGEIRAPADGKVSWTDRTDLADADAAVLAGGLLDGVTAPLTAEEAFDFADIAAIASAATGRTIRRVVVSEDEWVAARIAGGVPEAMARLVAGFFPAAARGDYAATGPLLGELIGRPPRSLREVLAEHLLGSSRFG